jgi:hypothetical protein
VGHYNYQTTAGNLAVVDQGRIDAEIKESFHARNGTVRKLMRADYKLATDLRGGEGVQVTVIGAREDAGDPLGLTPSDDSPGKAPTNPWRFLYQKRQIAAEPRGWNDFVLGRVSPF